MHPQVHTVKDEIAFKANILRMAPADVKYVQFRLSGEAKQRLDKAIADSGLTLQDWLAGAAEEKEDRQRRIEYGSVNALDPHLLTKNKREFLELCAAIYDGTSDPEKSMVTVIREFVNRRTS